MKRILCYGDSNTWGYDAVSSGMEGVSVRFPEEVRWTGVVQSLLGPEYRVLEEGLNGRTTAFDAPYDYGRNGYQFLEVAIRSCNPIDCIILMLGTNDLKDVYQASPYVITNSMARLVRTCRAVLSCTCSSNAKIIIAAPVNVKPDPNGVYQYDFSARSTGIGQAMRQSYRDLAAKMGCGFIDVNDYVQPDGGDGTHLSAESHRKLGEAMAAYLQEFMKDKG